MKTDIGMVRTLAKRMVTNHGSVWPYFSDEIRDALVDSGVMDAIRLADETTPVTPAEVVAFRDTLVRELAAGVFVGKTRRGLRFDRDHGKARPTDREEG